MRRIIGLSGYARSGKDTVADFLVNDHNFTKVSFAEPMRNALYALNPIVGGNMLLVGSDGISQYHRMYLQNVIDDYGWDGYKESIYGDEIRQLMQRLGTEVGRMQFGKDFWVSQAFANLPEGNIVFTDVRFHNEADAVKAAGGENWRIRRPGVNPANDHISETGLDDFDFDKYIYNDGDLKELSWKVAEAIG